MLLNETTPTGEELYECDGCRLMGRRAALVFQEDGGHLCFSCWHEKDRHHKRDFSSMIVEF